MKKLSIYTYLFHSEKYGIFLYNAVTNSFVKISEELEEQLKAVDEWNEAALDGFAPEFKEVLLKHKIVVDAGEPLLNFGTIERLSAAFQQIEHIKDIHYSIITNGYFLTEEKVEFF